MRISDWSSDVCSSDLAGGHAGFQRFLGFTARHDHPVGIGLGDPGGDVLRGPFVVPVAEIEQLDEIGFQFLAAEQLQQVGRDAVEQQARSEEHTSELQSLMRISYAVFCLKKKNINTTPLH